MDCVVQLYSALCSRLCSGEYVDYIMCYAVDCVKDYVVNCSSELCHGLCSWL